jgi:hypothetical protein
MPALEGATVHRKTVENIPAPTRQTLEGSVIAVASSRIHPPAKLPVGGRTTTPFAGAAAMALLIPAAVHGYTTQSTYMRLSMFGTIAAPLTVNPVKVGALPAETLTLNA